MPTCVYCCSPVCKIYTEYVYSGVDIYIYIQRISSFLDGPCSQGFIYLSRLPRAYALEIYLALVSALPQLASFRRNLCTPVYELSATEEDNEKEET